MPLKLFSYVDTTKSGFKLYNLSFIEIWRPFPIDIEHKEINTPRKTENIAIFIIRDEILLLSLLDFNLL